MRKRPFNITQRCLPAVVGALALGIPGAVQAEGSGQLGQIEPNFNAGLKAETELFVDVLAGDAFLNVAARGPGGAALTVTITDPTGAATTYNIDAAATGLVAANTLPAALPGDGVTPLSVPVTPGTYKVQFGSDVEPFDISVTPQAPSAATPIDTAATPAGGGRLYSRDWRFLTSLPGAAPRGFAFFVRAPVSADTEYLWKLDFEGLQGGNMCLTASTLGLPGDLARSSRTFAEVNAAVGTDPAPSGFAFCPTLADFPLYLSAPHSIKAQPQAPQLNFRGIGDCGAVLQGVGGSFEFDSSLPATYELVIDATANGTFDPAEGDVVIQGVASAGLNKVTWDGNDAGGVPLPAAGSPYAARLYLRTGEFHFTASDVESLSPGIAVTLVEPGTLAESATQIYWDDSRLNNTNGGTPATPERPLPDGVTSPANRHSWIGNDLGGFTYNGPGEQAFIDTWVFGDQTFADVAFTVYLPAEDEDADGLSNGRECEIGSVFDNPDTDGDGLTDGDEAAESGIPQDSDADSTADVFDVDDDGDGIPTALEGSDPNGDGDPSDARDTDGNGVPDYLDEDDDGDGVPTAAEGAGDGSGTPMAQDTDDDGTPDYLDDDDDGDGLLTEDEAPDANGDGDVADAQDSDGNGTPDYLDSDDDGDGLLTEDEIEDATARGNNDQDNDGDVNWLDTDSDGDGIDDATEGRSDDNDNFVPDYLEPPDPVPGDADGDSLSDSAECPDANNCPDSDQDGTPDVNDPDDDGDGIPTIQELGPNSDSPRNSDGDDAPDYLDPDDDGDTIPTRTEREDGATFGNDVDDDGDVNWLDTDSDGDGASDRVESQGDGDRNDDGIPDYLQAADHIDTDGDGVIDIIECPDMADCPDTDGDGTPDWEDEDDDGDGVLTQDELGDGEAPQDSDNDDTPDYLDTDDDDDGLFTRDELGQGEEPRDTDGDGAADYLDTDDDEDGLPTRTEIEDAIDYGGDVDDDGDVNWLDTDADGDGIGDGEEASGDNNGDADENGVPDYLEAASGPDTDDDGLSDADECPDMTQCRDTDGDGTPDYLDTDDDGDGVPTQDELGDGKKPQDTNDDGTPDYLDTDDDGDGVPTQDELGDGKKPQDTDDDGTPDYLDTDDDGDRKPTIDELGPDSANPQDTDDDGTPDYLDTDDDGDGKSTSVELGANPAKPKDTDDDGTPDYLDPNDNSEVVYEQAGALKGGGFRCAVQTPTHGGTPWAPSLVLLGLAASVWARRRVGPARSKARTARGGALFLALFMTALATLGSPPAAAQPSGIALNRFDPAERGSDWFWAESLDLRGSGRWALGITGDWAYKPLVAYDAAGDELRAVVRHQVFAHLGAAVTIADRLRLGLNLPILAYQRGAQARFDNAIYRADRSGGVGDLRFGADLRLFGEYGDAATMAIGAQAFFPTGRQEAYTSDGKVRIVPRLALAGDVGIFAYSARAGLNIHTRRENFVGEAFGTDLQFGVSAGLRLLDKKLLIGPELWTHAVVSDAFGGFLDEATTPFEGLLGLHYRAGDFRLGAGAGPGFTTGLGSPRVRMVASLEWAPDIVKPAPPPPPPSDRDGDGIYDPDDACPDVPGVASDDPTLHGCPEKPKDTDGDGIIDDEDACVNDEGPATDDPETNGCPDTDGDGIIDKVDACVREKGEPNEDKAKHGCPPPKDRDGDQILDEDDACPDEAGKPDPDPKKNGCPRVQVTTERVVILDRIEFDTNKATIRPESDEILEAVRDVLRENPQLTRIRVEGHTDNRGSRAHNRGLSERRALAVVDWLVQHGIGRERLVAQGFGPDRPVDDNTSAEGRQNNRRVEFHILETRKPE